MASRFDPASQQFTVKLNTWDGCIPEMRWVSKDGGVRSVLIYTDGAVPNNGRDGVRTGYPVTSNRAELHAAAAALEVREWSDEGWKQMGGKTRLDMGW
ncbi:hypothetical protein D9757_005810 [Collybiopsis confluens]|uniref:RNase H type-1 domain-containing protein n=1 Tax=Collybiopsis confluens TaxID=2823264 RepID=A0A8H5HQ15_9AGAR|nr:hypothetical protein D9757_005810 [Collybiopsis confluens]